MTIIPLQGDNLSLEGRKAFKDTKLNRKKATIYNSFYLNEYKIRWLFNKHSSECIIFVLV